MFSFADNHKSIKEINAMLSSGSLIVDESYQRRSIWGEKDKIRLIETILLKLVIPEVFFWQAEANPETGESVTRVTDGRQRIKAISSFIDNNYKLKPQYLLDEGIKEKYGNKFFKDLDPDVKTELWNYRLRIIEISQESTKEEIVQAFRRLNLTDFNLAEVSRGIKRRGKMRQTKEMKAASEHLRRISHVDALVERYTELASEQRALIDGVKSPVLSNGKTCGGAAEPDKLGAAITKLSELEEKLNGYIEELVELKADALQKIQMMDSIQERNLLTGRYLQGKTVDKLMQETEKERMWIYNHLNSALENFFNNFLKNDTK